jgi:MGT family glycosyltransferase
MAHFGIISPPVSGHINPFAALASELAARGHRITWFHMADIGKTVLAAGLRFHPIGQNDHPAGSLPDSLAMLGRLKGTAALRFTIRAVARTTEMFCRDAPAAFREEGVDVVLTDQMEPAGGSIAEYLGLPFITICAALAINRDPTVPPPFTPWRYGTGPVYRLRNLAGYVAGERTMAPITQIVNTWRRRWGLPPLHSQEDSFSKLAQICQMPAEFDFPRSALPPAFRYTGPLRFGEDAAPFPWERLTGSPIVYASLGTLQNRREPVFRTIAEACAGTGVQLIISHGGGLSDAEATALPGNPLVVPYAPQRALMARASLTISHAGLNTVLDSLSCGVPLVVMPITFEQPAIARRVEYCGAGRTAPFAKLEIGRLRGVIAEVAGESRYRQAAQRMAECIAAAGGVLKAADIIESHSTGGLPAQ